MSLDNDRSGISKRQKGLLGLESKVVKRSVKGHLHDAAAALLFAFDVLDL